MSGRGRGGGGRGAYFKAKYGGRGGRGGNGQVPNNAVSDHPHQNAGQSHDWSHLQTILESIDSAQYGKFLLDVFPASCFLHPSYLQSSPSTAISFACS